MGPGSSRVLGALWCNLSLIFEHSYSKTHQFFINNVCKFQNFHSPVKKKKKTFLQEKTYNVCVFNTKKNGQSILKTYYLAALHVADLGDLEWKIY